MPDQSTPSKRPRIPPVPLPLVEWLEGQFPELVPAPRTPGGSDYPDHGAVMHQLGKRAIVLLLRELHDRQQDRPTPD